MGKTGSKVFKETLVDGVQAQVQYSIHLMHVWCVSVCWCVLVFAFVLCLPCPNATEKGQLLHSMAIMDNQDQPLSAFTRYFAHVKSLHPSINDLT